MNLALTGKAFGKLPSELIGVPDPVIAYAVDEALALRLLFDEQAARRKKSKGSIPDGQRYETPADIAAAARAN